MTVMFYACYSTAKRPYIWIPILGVLKLIKISALFSKPMTKV